MFHILGFQREVHMNSFGSVLVTLASAAIVASFGALAGCQSASHRAVSSHASSFTVSMAAVSESNFAQRHQFYYYPSTQVYRDCDEDRWIWSEDGGLTWRSARVLPTELETGEEIPFAVTIALNEPATDHTRIAAMYPPEADTVTVRGESEFPY